MFQILMSIRLFTRKQPTSWPMLYLTKVLFLSGAAGSILENARQAYLLNLKHLNIWTSDSGCQFYQVLE